MIVDLRFLFTFAIGFRENSLSRKALTTLPHKWDASVSTFNGSTAPWLDLVALGLSSFLVAVCVIYQDML